MTDEMLWIDLETTGLDAYGDIPLELGLAVSDKWGNIRAEKSWLISEPDINWKIKMGLGASDKIVGPMHEKSGLWNDLLEARNACVAYTRANLDQAACDWLDSVDVPVFQLPMCGSSIGSLDKPFVLKHFPKLDKHFHYRNLDISSIKEAARRLNHPIFEAEPDEGDDKPHRVLDDIHWSIKLWKFYYTEFLIVADD